MNRADAHATLAAWRHILDGVDRQFYGTAVEGLHAAAEWFAAECERLETVVRADQADITQLAQTVRDHAPVHPRPSKAFVNEADAIADARKRGQCVVYRETITGPWVLRQHSDNYWSVPIERAYQNGALDARWQRMTPVELDQAQAIGRPA